MHLKTKGLLVMIRHITELLLRKKIIKRSIMLKGETVPIFVSPDSQLKYLKRSGSWDQDLINLASTQINIGDEVWDIGANVGVFSFAAAVASQSGRILAFEPDSFLVDVMKSSIHLNNLQNVFIIPVAISEKNGFAEFQIAKRGRASNCLKEAGGRSQMGGVRITQTVPTLSGDTFSHNFNSVPNFVKIDVEGAELFVLRGLARVLKQHKPKVYIEVSSKSKPEVASILQDLGYSAVDLDFSHRLSGDFLFVPKTEISA